MPKPKTTAVLVFVGNERNDFTFSTTGTRSAPGTSIRSWEVKWGDGEISKGTNKPPSLLIHTYKIDGNYDIVLTVTDGKKNQDSAYIDNMVIITTSVQAPPNAPSDLTSLLISSTEIQLQWQDNADNEDGFELERSLNGGAFELRTVLPAGTVQFNDTQVSGS